MLLFEWDEEKNSRNKIKHGITFEESLSIWSDPKMIRVKSIVNDTQEIRYLVIGTIKDKAWTAILTMRGQKIRLISVRRSRKNEEKLYHEP